MTDNPLAGAMKAKGVRHSHEEWCEIANAHARSIGRVDIRWVVRNNQPCIEWAVPPQC